MKSGMLLGQEARLALIRGVDKLANTARVTFGPCGRNVVLSRRVGAPLVTNDGVTIAREIYLSNPYENMGAQLMRVVSSKTNDMAGNGATTAIILAQTMIVEGVKYVAAGANPVEVRRGMQKTLEKVVETIRANTHPVRGKEDVERVGTISSGDAEIGRLISEIMEKLPYDSVISVEASGGTKTTAEVVEGMEFDRGFITPHMITDAKKLQAVLEEPYILLTDRKIGSFQELLPIIEQLMNRGKPLLIVADSFTNEALAPIVVNKMQRKFNCLCVKAPSLGERRRDLLLDMAVLTGGTVISEMLGMELADATIAMLGHAKKVISGKDSTLIIGGYGDAGKIKLRIEHVQRELERAEFDFDILKLRERAGCLAGGVGVIRVGAYTEAELHEKKLRIEDAVSATRAAARKGIVAGGCCAYLTASRELKVWAAENLEGEERFGAQLVEKALSAPLKQIAENAGLEGEMVLKRVLAKNDPDWGFDAVRQCMCNMIEQGILDPATVSISALQNAVSVASSALTTESLVADIFENGQMRKNSV